MCAQDNNEFIPSFQLITRIEKFAFNTWPAATAITAGNWIYRASGGITKRANSVWTAAGGPLPDGDWLIEAEQFYSNHGLGTRFHISDASPEELDPLLDNNGYVKEVPCTVLYAKAEEVIQKTSYEAGPNFQLSVHPQYDEEWLSSFLQLEGFGEERRVFYEKLFTDIEPLKSFFTLKKDGRCTAVGTAVVEEGWACFLNIAVHPELRGQGIGRMLLNELAVWSRDNGAHGLYLQVVDDNAPAFKLYTKAGYSPLYRYHYRFKKNI